VFAVSSIHQPSPTVDFNVSPPTVDVSSSNQVLESSETHCPSLVPPYNFAANCRIFLESTTPRLEEKLEKKAREKIANGHEKGANAYGVKEHVFLSCCVCISKFF
jgi:hypothetical protein